MSTHYTQWHKQDGETGAWHCWEVGKLPPGDAPICGASVSVDDAIFNNGVTLDDMCTNCRTYHLEHT